MHKIKLLLLLLTIALAGCGQKGPLLVKPETPPEENSKEES